MSADAALKRLMEGNARYVSSERRERDFSAGRAQRELSQRPMAAILSCSDSRVVTEFAFDEGPGNLFVVRVAGNVLTDAGLASIEYAIQFLGTRLLMVLGHSHCGAVEAAIKVVREGAALPGHLPDLISAIKPAVEAAGTGSGESILDAAIVENVRLTTQRLASAGPIVAKAVAEGQVKAVGAVYDLGTGRVRLL